MESALRESGLCVAPDALHHGHQAVRALRREVLPEVQQAECVRSIDADDLLSCLARIEREENGNQPAHDVGVAIADEAQARAGAVRLDLCRQPNLTHAALHLVGGRALCLGQGLKLAPELDDVAVTVLPIVEEGEIGEDLVEARHLPRVVERIHDSNIGRNGCGCVRDWADWTKKRRARKPGGKGQDRPGCAPQAGGGPPNSCYAGGAYVPEPSGPDQSASRSAGISVSCDAPFS